MRCLCTIFTVLSMAFALTTVANATLWDRGGGLIYDDFLDITWLQDPNYAQTSDTTLRCVPDNIECNPPLGVMPWEQAMGWAAQLEYAGYTGWRLPDAHNQDGTGPDITPAPGSEMGHMFFNNLGGVLGSFPGADFIDGYGNTVSFLWPSGDTWWLGDEWDPPTSAWYFVIGYGESSGGQHGMEKWRARYAWAVHDGDIGANPAPTRRPGILLDDFDDGNADGWVFPYNSWTQAPGGEWTVENGALVQHAGGDGILGLRNDLVIADQVVEVQIQTAGTAGVTVWYNPLDGGEANFVSVGYAEQTGWFASQRVDGVASSSLHAGPSIGGRLYLLKVQADRVTGALNVYLDGAYLFTHVATTPHRSGLSGVYSANASGYFDNFRVTSDIPAIDIVPGSTENRINLKKPGTVSVAILSALSFDAPAEVDRTSLTFGRTGDEASWVSCGKRPKDVNIDGRPDLVCSFSVSKAGFQAEDTEGVLKGRATGGIAFVSSDMVNIISRR